MDNLSCQNNPGKGVVNADGTTGKLAQVGLGHELGHAKDGIEGKITKEKSIVRDPDSGGARALFVIWIEGLQNETLRYCTI